MINEAFNPTTRKLVATTCEVMAEQEGVQNLFRGTMSFFKNPSSHRTVDYNDRQVAIQVIAFAEASVQGCVVTVFPVGKHLPYNLGDVLPVHVIQPVSHA